MKVEGSFDLVLEQPFLPGDSSTTRCSTAKLSLRSVHWWCRIKPAEAARLANSGIEYLWEYSVRIASPSQKRNTTSHGNALIQETD